MSTWGRSNPEDEPEAPIVRVERIGGGPASWRMLVGIACVVIAVGALWVKPWDSGRPSVALAPLTPLSAHETAGAAHPSTTSPPTAAPTLDPVVIAVRRRQCQSPNDWRVVTAESTITRDTRTMYPASPVRAEGPDDPALPLSHLYAGTMRAVGVCVPRSPVVSPVTTLLQVVMWQVAEDGTVREIQRPIVLDNALFDVGEAYYAPPAGEGSFWPQGRYVFEIRRIEGAGSRWIGLEFVATVHSLAVVLR